MAQKVYIFNGRTPPEARDDLQLFESFHGSKFKQTDWYKRLKNAAENDKNIQDWKNHSFKVLTGDIADPETGEKIAEEYRETRPIDKWWEESRFDQLVGGWVVGGPNSKLPTLQQGWDKDNKWGTGFKKELKAFTEYLKNNKDFFQSILLPIASPEETNALIKQYPFYQNPNIKAEVGNFNLNMESQNIFQNNLYDTEVDKLKNSLSYDNLLGP